MKNLVNRVQLIGHLGMDPEVKSFDNGSTMLRVSLATDASYSNKAGERVQDTQWHTLVGWGKTAELGKAMLKKGKKIAIEGTLVNRSYEDKNGKKRTTTEVRLEQFLMLEKKD